MLDGWRSRCRTRESTPRPQDRRRGRQRRRPQRRHHRQTSRLPRPSRRLHKRRNPPRRPIRYPRPQPHRRGSDPRDRVTTSRRQRRRLPRTSGIPKCRPWALASYRSDAAIFPGQWPGERQSRASLPTRGSSSLEANSHECGGEQGHCRRLRDTEGHRRDAEPVTAINVLGTEPEAGRGSDA